MPKIAGYPIQIRQVIDNMIGNAVKFTLEGFVQLKVKEIGESGLLFSVKDTGIGVPKDRQQSIFERFVQADLSKFRAYGGAGLGLSIAKAYVSTAGMVAGFVINDH